MAQSGRFGLAGWPWLVLAVLLLLWAPALSAQTRRSPKAATAGEANLAENPRLTEFFVDAATAQSIGDDAKALELYQKALQIKNQLPAAYYNIALILAARGELRDARIAAEKALQQDPENLWYYYLLGDLYTKLESTDQAIVVFENGSKRFSNELDLKLRLADAYLKKGSFDKALKLYDSIERQFGPTPELYWQRKDVFLFLNKPDSAQAVVNRYIALFPDDLDAYTELHRMLLNLGRTDQAVEVLNRLLERDPGNGYAISQLVLHYQNTDQLEKAQRFEEQIISSNSITLTAKLQYLGRLMSRAGTEEAHAKVGRFTRQLYAQNPEDPMLNALLGEMYENRERFDSAQYHYLKSLRANDLNTNVWQALLTVTTELGQTDSMLKYSEQALELFPNNGTFNYLNGLALLQAKRYDEAARPLEKFIRVGNADNELLAQVHTLLGTVYHRLNKPDQQNANLEKAIGLDPNNLVALNNWAYFLAVQDRDLEKALTMIEKVMDRQPDNPTYQDTYGYVLLKLKRHSEARLWLEKAYNANNSSETAEHLGDLHLQTGNLPKAREFWQLALDKDPNNADIRQKLDQHRP